MATGIPTVIARLSERVARTASLVRILAPRELRIRYRQSVLDASWALISPVVIMAVYGVVLTQSFDVTGGCGPYLSSAWIGLVLWTFFATSVGTAAHSLLAASDMVTKVYFPREALPLASVGASLADLGIGLVTVVIVVLIQGIALGWAALAAILPVIVLVVWTAAISVVVGIVGVFVRDVVHLVQLAIRVGFFATPVMYEAGFLPSALAWSADVSPLAVAIAGVRTTVMCGEAPDVPLLLVHFGLATATLLAAIGYSWSVESRISDVI